MNMKCVYCGALVTDGVTTEDYNWGGEYLVVIKNVPSGICQSCGERYFESNVIRKMEMLAQPLIIKAKYPSKKLRMASLEPIAVVNYTDGRIIESQLSVEPVFH